MEDHFDENEKNPPGGATVAKYSKQILTLKDMGGWADSAHWSGDRLPFLTGSYYGHKIS